MPCAVVDERASTLTRLRARATAEEVTADAGLSVMFTAPDATTGVASMFSVPTTLMVVLSPTCRLPTDHT